MHIKAYRREGIRCVIIDGNRIDNVADYKITTSADGATEVVIKIKFVNDCSGVEAGEFDPSPTSSAN